MSAAASSALAVSCERCGASVPLLVETHARCVYCLHDNAVPEAVKGQLERREALDRDVERAVAEGAGAADRHQKSALFLAAFIIGSLVLGGAPTIGWLAASLENPKTLVTLIILGVSWIPFVAIPIAWLLLVRDRQTAHLSAVPLAVPRAGDAVAADCPTCGAGLTQTTGAVTARCTHCMTESLLPLPMVQAGLRWRHRKAMKARAASTDAMKEAVATWQKHFVPAILGFNVIAAVAIGLALLVYSLLAK